VKRTLSVFGEPTLDDPAIVRFQGYDMCKEGISVDEYGYASDSDLDEEDDEVDETIQNTPTAVNDLAIKEAHCTILSRSVLVKDTAFDTCGLLLPYYSGLSLIDFHRWLALLYYMYTDEIFFAPLRSQGSRTARHRSFDVPPPCSPKSMYRLACKVGLLSL
jgi:hypothetical protein